MATGQVIDTELAWSETDIHEKSQILLFSLIQAWTYLISYFIKIDTC